MRPRATAPLAVGFPRPFRAQALTLTRTCACMRRCLSTGKSTLLKLMVGTLDPLDGMVKRHNHLRIGQYHQHLTELLPMEASPLEYMMDEYKGLTIEAMRSVVSVLALFWSCGGGSGELGGLGIVAMRSVVLWVCRAKALHPTGEF